MVKLTECERLYFSFLNSGELWGLDKAFTGYIDTDYPLWLTYYKKLST